MKDSTLNSRPLALTMLVVVLFTCGMFWLNRSDVPLGYAHYEKYGFSLLYPKLTNVHEEGLSIGLGSEPSDLIGLVQWQSYWEGKLEIFEVIWLVTSRASNTQAELDRFVAMISQPNVVIRSVGEPFMASLHGEEVECTYIEVEQAGNAFSGVIGVVYQPWSSPGLDRVYFVVYATFRGSLTDEQLRDSFQTYLDGFTINEPKCL
jgi:hypothetical protein